MADRQQQPQDHNEQVRRNRKRLAFTLVLVGLSLIWGGRIAVPLITGWFNSCQVLDRRAKLADLDRQIEDLNEELAYARTSEGMDVEAKRRFGVGPPQDVLIQVHVKSAPQAKARPISIGERAWGGINRIGGACMAAVHRARDVAKYWSGLGALPPAPVEEQRTGERDSDN